MKPKIKIILAMVAFGTIGIFVRNISMSSGEIALFRAVIAASSIILFKVFGKQTLAPKIIKKELGLLFLSGMVMGFNWILFFEAYRYTTVSLATLSYYFASVLVIIASPVIFKETLTKWQVFCFFMASIGLVLVIGITGATSNSTHITGIVLGLGAAFLYATVIILNKCIKGIAGIDRTLIQFGAAIIVLLPYTALTSGFMIGKLDGFGIINLLILGVVHTGVCYCLYFSSLKDLKGQEAAILSYLDPFTAILVSVIILGESIHVIQVIGGIMILGFTLLNELNLGKKKEKSNI